MSKFAIVYCHPYDKSFNHAILLAVCQNLSNRAIGYTILDLYHDGFQPTYDQEELSLFHSGQTHDPLVKKYLNTLKEVDGLIIVTPVWWNDIPAMLKGFIDKVMKEGPGLSHVFTKRGVKGLLTNLKHVYVLTTSTSPTFYLRLFCGNALQGVFIKHTLRQLGIRRAHWQNFGNITHSSLKQRQKYLEYVTEETIKY